MQVRLGWSGEIEPGVWRKADVELGDVDLGRMVKDSASLSTRVAFQLLQAEAEILLMTKLAAMGFPQEKASNTIVRLTAENAALLKKIAQTNPSAES